MKIFSVLGLVLVLFPSISSAFAPFLHIAVTRNSNNNKSPYSRSTSSAIFNSNGASTIADFKVAHDENWKKAFLLDVREPNEWAEAHLTLATPHPLSTLTSGKWMDNQTGKYYPGTFPIDRFTGVSIELNTKIWVHCKMGGRAKQAAEVLQQMGYKDVVVVEETFEELVASKICDVIGGEVQSLSDPSG